MRALVLGAGHQGKKHIAALEGWGVEVDAYDMWAEVACDFAIVSSPDRFHYNQVMSLLSAGIPIFCEKPLCLEPHELDDITDRCRRTGGILSMNLPMRARMPELKSQPYRIDASYNWGRKDEKREWEKVGPHLCGGIHLLDIMRLYLGPVVEAKTIQSDECELSVISFARGSGTLTSDLKSSPPHHHYFSAWYPDERRYLYDGKRENPDTDVLESFVAHIRDRKVEPMVTTEDTLGLMEDVFKL